MTMNLRWIVSFSASCIHAAEAIRLSRPLSDPRISGDFIDAARELQTEAAVLPEAPFWRNLTGLAHQIENNRELVATTIRKTVGPNKAQDELVAKLAARITQLESDMRSSIPQLLDELTHRGRPIRDLWEAYGPGLLRQIGKLADERIIAASAEVVLVLPVTAGGGAAHLQNNSVRFEAVLTNNVPQLPEVMRLAWLLAQLQHDLPVFGEAFHPDRLPLVAALATLPPTLQAAQNLELATFDADLLRLAISSWLFQSDAEKTAETLGLWWQTYQETQLSWPAAFVALDRMLAE